MDGPDLANAQALAAAVRAMHADLRSAVLEALAEQDEAQLRRGDTSAEGDTVYGIDRVSESALLDVVARHLAAWLPIVLVAEGLPDVGLGLGTTVIPPAAEVPRARHWMIVDPIDGTRGLMYGKRSAWILTGVAPATAGRTPRSGDIVVAVQTEIPPVKQTLADTLWAVRGHGAAGERIDLRDGTTRPLPLSPSGATSLDHGFGQVMRAFPGGRDVLAAIDDDVCLASGGAGTAGRGVTFEDQYICTGGQLAELVLGHDRWVADLRPLLAPVLARRGLPAPQCAHPYDICTVLVATEAGVVVTGVDGPLDHGLVLTDDIAWAGYANEAIQALVQPALDEAIRRHLRP